MSIAYSYRGLLAFEPDGNRAADGTPVSTWRQVDDKTGKVKSIIQINDNNGQLQEGIEGAYLR